MAKKSSKASGSSKSSGSTSTTSKVVDMLKDMFANVVLTQIVSWFKETIHEVQESIYLTTKKILESALSMTLLLFGIAMIVFALPFLLSHYLQMPASLFFVIMGLILIIVSVISFDHINRSKYKKF